VHGYVAFFGARYFSAEASNSILAFVRKLNKEAIEKTKKQVTKLSMLIPTASLFPLKTKPKNKH